MQLRTDRPVAIAAAVTVIPLALLVVVKAGLSSSAEEDPDTMAPNVAAARQDPAAPSASPEGGAAPAGTGSPLPGGGTGGAGGGAGGRGAGGAARTGGNGAGGSSELPELPPGTPKLKSFVRVTDVKLDGAPGGDYQHLRETANFTLSPAYAMNATGVHETMKDGGLTSVTEKVVVKGSTLSGYDGREWTHSKLTAAQLSTLRHESDPRVLTAVVRGLPGVTLKGPDANGSTQFLAKTALEDLYALLPEEAAGRARAVLPGSSVVSIDLWADSSGRPSWIGLGASGAQARFAGSMTFSSYR